MNMKVELWFDFLCPFSYVAKTYLDKAIHAFDNKEAIDVSYHSFCVAPYVKETLDVDSHEFLSFHKDITYAQAKELHEHLEAKFSDVVFNFDTIKITSSNKAHQILHMIDASLRSDFIDLVFEALYVDLKDISKEETLIEIGAKLGIKEEDIKAVFLTDMYNQGIEDDYDLLVDLDLKGVPTIVIDRMYFLSGAQSIDAYQEMLKTLYDPKKQTLSEVCEDCEYNY